MVGTLNAPLSKHRSGQETAREILGYFLRNPRCADTLEGVASWRLMDEMIHRAVQETNNALEWLVAQGYLVTELATGSDRIFRLNQEARDEALRFVKSVPPHCSLESQPVKLDATSDR